MGAGGSAAEYSAGKRTLVLTAVRAHTGRTPQGAVTPSRRAVGRSRERAASATAPNIARHCGSRTNSPKVRNERATFSGLTLESIQKSEIYHRYASCTKCVGGSWHEAIRLTTRFRSTEFASSEPGAQLAALTEFLASLFPADRETDGGRRYARFYAPPWPHLSRLTWRSPFYNGSTLVPPAARFPTG